MDNDQDRDHPESDAADQVAAERRVLDQRKANPQDRPTKEQLRVILDSAISLFNDLDACLVHASTGGGRVRAAALTKASALSPLLRKILFDLLEGAERDAL